MDFVLKPSSRIRRFRWGRIALLALVLAVVTANGLAFALAWATTHYGVSGRNEDFERLSNWAKVGRFSRDFSLPRPLCRRIPGQWASDFSTVHYPGAGKLDLESWRVPGQAGKPIVLLFPGYNASKSALVRPAAEFHALGFETWLVDFHGSGGSAGHTTTVGYDEAEDVIATIRQALANREGDPQLVLYGTSMGAAAILCAVHRYHLTPAALILECPFDRLLTTVGNRCNMLGLPAFPAANLIVLWGGIQGGFNGFTYNPVEYARAVRCLTLLMEGDMDERVGIAHAREIAAALGERCTFKVFRGAGHLMYLDHAPAVWRAEVRGFLETHLSQANGGAR